MVNPSEHSATSIELIVLTVLLSFPSLRFAANEAKQIKDLKNYIKKWNSDKNLVLITHFVVISSILNTGSSSGEIIISDKNFNIIGSIDMM